MTQFIDDLECNYWIKANAGSGKTTILVERFLFLLENGIKPEDILCITYTNAGAEEMKKRIQKSLETEDIKQSFISKGISEKQLEYIKNHLQISTIHGFCQEFLIKQNKINKNAVILNADARKMEKIVNNVIDDISSKSNINKNISFIAQNLSIQEFQKLIEEIINNQNKFRDLDSDIFVKYVKDKERYKITDIDKKIKNLLPDEIRELVNDDIVVIENCLISQLKEHRQSELNEIVINVFKTKREKAEEIMYSNLYDLANWEELVLTGDKPRKTKPKVSKELQDLWLGIQNYYVKKNNKISADMSYYILQLAVEVLSSYEKIKQDENTITYDDMLYETKMFANEGKLTKIKYIMLDEAQDTNPLCWEIIEKFCDKNDNQSIVFVVGDVKQSIYSFQGANLDYYDKYYNIFKNRTINKDVSKWDDNVNLVKSYRSVKDVLDIADFLCETQQNAFGNDDVKHFSIKEERIEQSDNFFDIQFGKIEKENEINSWLEILKYEQQKQEELKQRAEFFVKKILEIAKNDEKTAIIVPKRNTKNGLAYEIVGEIQQEKNVELSTDFAVKSIYFQDLLCFFKFYILQNDDLSLACLLKSDFFNLNDDILEEICNHKDTLWNNIQSYEWRKEIKDILSFFRELLEKQTISEIIDFIAKNIEEKQLKNYKNYISLLEFIAKQFLENGGFDFDIRNFLDYVENNNEKYDFHNNITTANIFFSTIHGVKGLEYDNVVLLDFDEKNVIKTDKMMFLNTFIGQDSKKYFFYKTKQIIDNTCSLDNLQKAIKHEENKVILEKWRLLYVAITRAKRRFYYFGNFEKSQFGKFFNDYLTNIKI